MSFPFAARLASKGDGRSLSYPIFRTEAGPQFHCTQRTQDVSRDQCFALKICGDQPCFHQKILWISSGEYDSYLWRKRPRDLRVSCVPGRLALLLLHRCWFSRTRIEAEESSTVPKKTLVQSLDICCLSGQCFVLKNQPVKHFTIHSGTCPELTLLLRWQLLPCWTRARWHLQRQDAVFPILPPVFCVRSLHAKKTMISFEMEQTRGSVWSASSKTQWQSQGWVGFSRRIRVPSSDTAGLGGKEATFSSGKGCRRKGSLKLIFELYISTQTASKQKEFVCK